MSRLLESLTKELTRAVKDGVDEAKKTKSAYKRVDIIYGKEGGIIPASKTITDFEIESEEIKNVIGKAIISIGKLLEKETDGDMKLFTDEKDVWSGKILSGSSEFLFSRANDVNAEANEIGDVSVLIPKEYAITLADVLISKVDKKINPTAIIRKVDDSLLKRPGRKGGNDEDENIEVFIELEFKTIDGKTKQKGIHFYFESAKINFKTVIDKNGKEKEVLEIDPLTVMLKKMRYDDFKKGIKQVFYKMFLKSIIQAVGHRKITDFFGLQPVVVNAPFTAELIRLNGEIEKIENGAFTSSDLNHQKKLTSKYKLNMKEGIKTYLKIVENPITQSKLVVKEEIPAVRIKGTKKVIEMKNSNDEKELEKIEKKYGALNSKTIKKGFVIPTDVDNVSGAYRTIVTPLTEKEKKNTSAIGNFEKFLEIIFGADTTTYLKKKKLLTTKRLQSTIGLANLIREAEAYKSKGHKTAFEMSVDFKVGIMTEFINLLYGFDTDGSPYIGLLDEDYNKDVQMRNFVVSTISTGLGVAKNTVVKKMLEKARLEYKKYLMEQKNLNEDFGKDFDYVTSTTIIENKLDIKISNELDNFFGSLVESLDVNEDEISDEDLEDVNEKKKKGKKTKLPKKIIDLRKKELAKIKENKDCPDCQKRREERLDEKKKRKGKKLPKDIIKLRIKELSKIKA